MKHIVKVLLFLLFTSSLVSAQSPTPKWMRVSHSGGISDAAFSPDGQFIATVANADNRVLIWDLTTSSFTPRILTSPDIPVGYQGGLLSVAISPNSQKLYLGGESMIYVLDVRTSELLDTIPTDGYEVNCLTLSGSGDSLAWITGNGICTRYDLNFKRVIDTTQLSGFRSNLDSRQSFQFSNDLNRMLCSGNHLLEFSPVRKETPLAQFGGTGSISANGKRVALSQIDRIIVIDLQTFSQIDSLDNPGTPVRFSTTGDSLFIYGNSGGIVDLRSNRIFSIVDSDREYSVPHVSTDFSHLFINTLYLVPMMGRSMGSVSKLIDTRSGTIRNLVVSHSDIDIIAWSAGSSSLVLSDISSFVTSLDGSTGGVFGSSDLIRPYTGDFDWNGVLLSFIPNTDTCTVVYRPDLGTGGPAAVQNFVARTMSQVKNDSCFDITWNYQIIYSSLHQAAIEPGLLNLDDCQISDLKYPIKFDFTPDGSTLIAGDTNSIVAIDTKTLGVTVLPIASARSIQSIKCATSGDRIAVNRGTEVDVMTFPGCALLETFKHRGGITDDYFSPNSHYLVTSGYDSTMNVWSLANGNVAGSYSYPDVLRTGGFSFDSKFVSAIAGRNEVIVWDAPAMIGVTESSVPLNLSLQLSYEPASTNARIAYQLPAAQQISIELVDVVGRTIRTVYQGYSNASSERMLSTNDLPAGTYFCRLTCHAGTITLKLVVK